MKRDYYGFNEDQLVVVAAPTGRILKTVKPEKWQDTPVLAPDAGYQGDLVNVFLVTTSGDYYSIVAFMNLKRGSDFDGPSLTGPETPSKPVRLSISEPLSFNRLTISTEFYGSTIENIADTAGSMRNRVTEGGQVFSQIVKNGEGHYGFIDVDQENKATISLSALANLSYKKTIKLDPKMDQGFIRIIGTFDADSKYLGYDLYSTWGKSQLDVFYPDIQFEKYFVSLNYTSGNRSGYERRESSDLDLEFKAANFDAKLVNADPRSFDIDLNGNFDYYVASYEKDNSFLSVYNSHLYETFSIPDFSEIYGLKEFPFSRLDRVTIRLVDETEFTEEEEHFKFFTSGKFPLPRNRTQILFNEPIN